MHNRPRMLLLSAIVLGLLWLNLGSDRSAEVVSAAMRQTPTGFDPDVAKASAGSQQGSAANAFQIERPMLEVGEQDPFAAEAPKPLERVRPAPPPMPQPVVAITLPPPLEPPHLNLIYSGRMTTPDGITVIYASMGDVPIALVSGIELANGYRVTKITDRAVEFSFPALDRTARLDIPAAQKYETR